MDDRAKGPAQQDEAEGYLTCRTERYIRPKSSMNLAVKKIGAITVFKRIQGWEDI